MSEQDVGSRSGASERRAWCARAACALGALLVLACTYNTIEAAPEAADAAPAEPGAVPAVDGATADAASASDACVVGDPQSCGACAKVCAGRDDATTARTCSDATPAATCGITCKADSYDVDGDAANGCEAADTPNQSTPELAVAVAIPSATPIDINGRIYSDQREHDAAPARRPLGLPDWWKVTATGAGNPAKKMHACLFIGTYPADSIFELCISEQGSKDPTVCTLLTPLTPPGNGRCAFAADDAGTFYVRVTRKAGASTPNTFALYLEH